MFMLLNKFKSTFWARDEMVLHEIANAERKILIITKQVSDKYMFLGEIFDSACNFA